MPISSRAAALAVAAALAGCKSDGGGNTGPADQCPQNDQAREGTRVELGVGQSVQLFDAARNACVLIAGSGRYLVSVGNSNQTVTQTAGFRLMGEAGSATASIAPSGESAPLPAPSTAAALFQPDARDAADVFARQRRLRAHGRMLDLNRTLIQGMGSPRAAWRAERARRRALGVTLSAGPGAVGTVSEVRILNRDDPGGNLCSNVNHLAIGARTVYVGTHSIVLEDTLSAFRGQMDTTYVRLAQEFDATMFSILQEYFGNPLAMDAELDNNGRIVMVFSPKINAFGDIAGFVVNCDFFPRAQAAVSNEGEYFYALVPDSLDGGIRIWDKSIRATLIHEVKHVTSNAERFVNEAATALEARWLEEATAVHAEEIWARTHFGNPWKGNATYAQTLFCERRFGIVSNPQCLGKPLVMYGNYSLLYDYLEQNERYTPLGPVDDDDFVFYGAAWNLVRWAVDNYATTEQAFFRGLTQSALVGVANLEARTGRPWPEMLSDWSLAVATDDRAGFAPAREQHRIQTWNTRDIFAGMNGELPANFARPFPLVPRAISFGTFTETVAALRSGSFALFELSGSGSAQILELRGTTEAQVAPPGLVMQIVRVQ